MQALGEPQPSPDLVARLQAEAPHAGQAAQAAQAQSRQLLAADQRQLLQGSQACGAAGKTGCRRRLEG